MEINVISPKNVVQLDLANLQVQTCTLQGAVVVLRHRG